MIDTPAEEGQDGPEYDVYVEADRITIIPKQEQVVDNSAVQNSETYFQNNFTIPLIFMGSHALIVLLSLMLVAYVAFIPHITTVYVLTNTLPTHPLPAVTLTQSQSTSATGHRHIAATQARGYITFYNSLTQSQIIDTGTLLVGADGEQVVTDQGADLPPGTLTTNGRTTVRAHSLNYGTEGNIRAGDIYGPCCRQFVQAVNAPFSGGHNARDFKTVAKDDIATATSEALAQVQQKIAEINFGDKTGETLVTPVPCNTSTSSNHAVEAEAAQVVVTVSQFCTPSAYNLHALQQTLAALVAGKTPQEARTLLQMAGMRGVGIHLDWLLDRLPADSNRIHVVLLYQPT